MRGALVRGAKEASTTLQEWSLSAQPINGPAFGPCELCKKHIEMEVLALS